MAAMNTLIAFYQNIGPAITVLVIVTFLLAGAVKGVIGLGLPTIAMACSVWLCHRHRLRHY